MIPAVSLAASLAASCRETKYAQQGFAMELGSVAGNGGRGRVVATAALRRDGRSRFDLRLLDMHCPLASVCIATRFINHRTCSRSDTKACKSQRALEMVCDVR